MQFFKISKKAAEGYPWSVIGWKNGLTGLFDPVRLGQVREALKSSKFQNTEALNYSLVCFGQRFEGAFFRPSPWTITF
jgi:hypothetical protein